MTRIFSDHCHLSLLARSHLRSRYKSLCCLPSQNDYLIICFKPIIYVTYIIIRYNIQFFLSFSLFLYIICSTLFQKIFFTFSHLLFIFQKQEGLSRHHSFCHEVLHIPWPPPGLGRPHRTDDNHRMVSFYRPRTGSSHCGTVNATRLDTSQSCANAPPRTGGAQFRMSMVHAVRKIPIRPIILPVELVSTRHLSEWCTHYARITSYSLEKK